MLGKLIKNDFKASAHSMLAIYIAAIAICGVAVIPFAFEKMEILQALAVMSLMLASWVMLILPIFLLLSYFNKSLYSNQGYLSYTLPVRSRDMLFSKAVVTFFWIVLSYLFYIGIYAFIFFILTFLLKEGNEDLIYALEELIEAFAQIPIGEIIKFFVKAVIVVVSVFFFEILVIVSQMFFSITLSNIKPFSYLKAFGGILLFVSISVAMIIIFAILTFFVPGALVISGDGIKLVQYSMATTPYSFGIAGLVFQLIASVGMFVGTNFLMKKKVNIK